MIDVIEATFQDGVFKPDRQPALSDRTRVRLVVESASDPTAEAQRQQAWTGLEFLWQNSTFNSHGDRLSRDELHERG
jgi:predicted DNA-binding antitoxin AbrB/MazE fold protein